MSDIFYEIFEYVGTHLYFRDRNISTDSCSLIYHNNSAKTYTVSPLNEELFIVMHERTILGFVGGLCLSREFDLSPSTCVSLLDLGISISYIDKNGKMHSCDNHSMRRCHAINQIIDDGN